MHSLLVHYNRWPANVRGIALMFFGTFIVTINLVFIRFLRDDLPSFELLFIRYLFSLIIVARVVGFYGIGQLNGSPCDEPRACKMGDVTAVVPIEFMRLVRAAVIGFMVFTEIPALWTLVGGGLIFSSTIYLSVTEQKRKDRGVDVEESAS